MWLDNKIDEVEDMHWPEVKPGDTELAEELTTAMAGAFFDQLYNQAGTRSGRFGKGPHISNTPKAGK